MTWAHVGLPPQLLPKVPCTVGTKAIDDFVGDVSTWPTRLRVVGSCGRDSSLWCVFLRSFLLFHSVRLYVREDVHHYWRHPIARALDQLSIGEWIDAQQDATEAEKAAVRYYVEFFETAPLRGQSLAG